MFNDGLIQKWITEYGKATSFTFLVYGKIKEDEVDLITKGILGVDDKGEIAIFYDDIDEEQAYAWIHIKALLYHMYLLEIIAESSLRSRFNTKWS